MTRPLGTLQICIDESYTIYIFSNFISKYPIYVLSNRSESDLLTIEPEILTIQPDVILFSFGKYLTAFTFYYFTFLFIILLFIYFNRRSRSFKSL